VVTLFTYTIPVDDGAAPNPFHGMCSLAICKPAIRRTASPGDWVAGLGSRNAPSGDLSGRLVYAMRVDEVVTLRDYDRLAPSRWPHRIPDVWSRDPSVRLGDCIYDFSSGSPIQRKGVHGPDNELKDLRGKNALLSRHFFYFGREAIPLPVHLFPICHQTQGHSSKSNAPYTDAFIRWLRSLMLVPCRLYGQPDVTIDWATAASRSGCTPRSLDDDRG